MTEQSSKKVSRISISPEIMEKIEVAIKGLPEKVTKHEFIEKAVEAYLSGTSTQLSDEPKAWFQNSKKFGEIRELLAPDEYEIVMSELELLETASRLSGLSIAEIERQGREYMAMKLITSSITSQAGENKEGHTRGVAGAADSRLDSAYARLKKEFEEGILKPVGGRIKASTVAYGANTSTATAKKWAERRGYTELL